VDTTSYHPRARVLLEVLLEDWGDGSTTESYTLDVVPMEVEVARNGPREADTVRVEIGYRDLPLDPRSVRGILVHVFLGDVGSADAELQMDADTRLAFVGVIDEPSTSLEESGEKVTLEGRDLTAFWLDHDWTASIDLDQDLPRIVEQMQAAIPGASGLTVEYAYESWALRPADVIGRTVWTPGKGEDAWTVLTQLLGAVGLIPIIELTTLRITTLESWVGTRQAVMLYGDNVERLTFRRDLKQARTQRVELTCWDEQARESRVASWPESPAARKVVGTDGVTEDSGAVSRQAMVGSYTVEQLKDLAKATWLERARGEFHGELETREMLDGDGATDLTRLAAGDVLTVTLGKGDPSAFGSMSEAEAVAFLTAGARGLDRSTAQALVASWRRAEDLKPWFYVQQATHRWAASDGYHLRIEFTSMVGDE